MKKKILSLILVCLLLVPCFAMSGCGKKEYTVEFFFIHTDRDVSPRNIYEEKVKAGDKVAPFNIYEHKNTLDSIIEEYYLDGWYQETSCLNPWPFYQEPVTCNMKLYAKLIPKKS